MLRTCEQKVWATLTHLCFNKGKNSKQPKYGFLITRPSRRTLAGSGLQMHPDSEGLGLPRQVPQQDT